MDLNAKKGPEEPELGSLEEARPSPDSPDKELAEEVEGKYKGVVDYWMQRKLVLKEPNLILENPRRSLTMKPLKFALYMTIIPGIVTAALGYGIGLVTDLQPTPLERSISAVKTAKERVVSAKKNQAENPFLNLPDLRLGGLDEESELERELKILEAQSRTAKLMEPVQELFFSISLVSVSILFSLFLRERTKEYPALAFADTADLYYVTARTFFPNVIVVSAIYGINLAARFGKWDSDELLGATYLVVFICGIWQLILMRNASRELIPVLGLNVGSLAKKKHFLENRLGMAAIVTNICLLVGFSILGSISFVLFYRLH